MLAVRQGLQDLKSAFRTVPTRQPQYHTFGAYIHDRNQVEFFYTPGHVFGLGISVLTFNRYAEFMAVIARCWLALPVEHFFDDYILVDFAYAGNTGEESFLQLFFDAGDNYPTNLREKKEEAPLRLLPSSSLSPRMLLSAAVAAVWVLRGGARPSSTAILEHLPVHGEVL